MSSRTFKWCLVLPVNGDIIFTLQNGTKVDPRSVPKFREIAKYCFAMAEKPVVLAESRPKVFETFQFIHVLFPLNL